METYEQKIEIPFGAKDSELQEWTYTIPEGMEAEIKDGKVIIKRKENEDERIRKGLLDIFKKSQNGYWAGMEIKDIVAWLEKQKEQKPAKWSEDDRFKLEDAITGIDAGIGFYETEGKHPNLLKAIIVAKEWLKSLPERFNLQPKNEWSEDDEHIIGRLRSIVNKCAFYDDALDVNGEFCEGDYAKLDSWLKSLQLQAKQEQSTLEYLPKEKINAIIDKLTDLSYSKLIPFKSRESQKIDEISSDVLGLLDYPIEKKQEVDLEKELQAFLCNYDYEFDDDVPGYDIAIGMSGDIARHFYELGRKVRKEE